MAFTNRPLSVLRRLMLIGGVLCVGFVAAAPCKNIQYSTTCGRYQEIGEIECAGNGQCISVIHPYKIVWPSSINFCIDSYPGQLNCNSSGEWVTAVETTYGCHATQCTVIEIGDRDVQRCPSATLSGGPCQGP